MWRNGALRRLVLTNLGFKTSEMGAWISVTVEAHRRGGVALAGGVLVAQLAPAALVAVGAGRMIRRLGAVRTATVSLLVQCVATVGLVLTVLADAPTVALVGCAVVGTIGVVVTRPAQATVLSGVTDDPHALTATHVVLGWSDSLGTLLGPAVTGLALAAHAPAAAFGVYAAVLAAATVTARSLPEPTHAQTVAHDPAASTEPASARHGIAGALALLGIHAFVIGCLDLLVVVVAVDVVHAPSALAGWLATALGCGGLTGALAATALIGRRSVGPAIIPSGVATAAVLALGGRVDGQFAALAVFAVIGAALALLGVVARCALQRLASSATVAHVFSLAEAADTAMLLASALVLPGLVRITSPQAAPAVIAAALTVVCLAVAPLVRGGERRVDLSARLRTVAACELFHGLDAAALSTLARNAVDDHFAPGAVLMREGEPGDCFHLIVTGTVGVVQHGRHVVDRGPGEGVGEAALLTDAPRNATLTATTAVQTLRIEREPFLLALGAFGDARFADL